MRTKSQKLIHEIKRKLFHILILIYPITYYLILTTTKSKFIAIMSITLILAIFLTMEHFRINKEMKIPYVEELYRELEDKKIGGEIYYMLGCIITLLLLDLRIAAASILMVNFGDALSTIIGISFGKKKIVGNKTLPGFLAGLFINVIITILILGNLTIAIPMALTASITELFSKRINDNLTIPIISGTIGQIIRLVI